MDNTDLSNNPNSNNTEDNSIGNLFTNIVTTIEHFIDNNIDSEEKVLNLEKSLKYMLISIKNIIKGNYYNFSKSQYSNIINELEYKINELYEKEREYKDEISNLQYELISNQKFFEVNKPIKQETYESIIKKLKKKFREEKDLYKLNEIKYIDKIEDLSKVNRDLSKKIEDLEIEKSDLSQSLNSTTIKIGKRINSAYYKRNQILKGKSTLNVFKNKTPMSVSPDVNKKNENILYNNFRSNKFIDFKKKKAMDNRFRLYKLYQKNKNTDLQNKFLINQNYDKFNFIINTNNKNIKHLLPRNPFERKEKHYYSAFLKY